MDLCSKFQLSRCYTGREKGHRRTDRRTNGRTDDITISVEPIFWKRALKTSQFWGGCIIISYWCHEKDICSGHFSMKKRVFSYYCEFRFWHRVPGSEVFQYRNLGSEKECRDCKLWCMLNGHMLHDVDLRHIFEFSWLHFVFCKGLLRTRRKSRNFLEKIWCASRAREYFPHIANFT
jgi:hypothetical protein